MFQICYAQKATNIPFDMKAKMEEADKAANKTLYLQSYLKQCQENPAKYRSRSQKSCDSIALVMQLDYQALLLTMFKNSSNEKLKKIAEGTGKSFAMSMQMINERDWLPYRQGKLDKQIAKVNELIIKSDCL